MWENEMAELKDEVLVGKIWNGETSANDAQAKSGWNRWMKNSCQFCGCGRYKRKSKS